MDSPCSALQKDGANEFCGSCLSALLVLAPTRMHDCFGTKTARFGALAMRLPLPLFKDA